MIEQSKLAPPRVVALTGAIGCGKSAVGRLFVELGVPWADADLMARAIHQDPGHPATAAIAVAFPEAMTRDGRLARGSLRSLFALCPDANAELKRILKPHVEAEIARWVSDQQAQYVMVESVLALEQGMRADRVLVVDASRSTRLARVQARNPDWTTEQIERVFSIQSDRETYLNGADDVLTNEGGIHILASAIAALHQQYLAIWSPGT